MRERLGQILKIACYVLAALLFYQLVQTALRVNPLRRVAIPELPTLASETNSLAGALPSGPARTGTNSSGTNSLATGAPGSAPARPGTNSLATNSTMVKAPKEPVTNLIATVRANADATNFTVPLPYPEEDLEKPLALGGITNAPGNSPPNANMAEANPASLAPVTNAATNLTATPDNSTTNLLPIAMGTNISPPITATATNGTGTNASSKSKKTNSSSSGPAMAAMNMNSAMMRGGGGGKSDLPPEVKARVEKIYESELFGQVMRPQPMALQGIAGNSAFLRTPSGQTGLVKEGDSLGEMKLLRIGINRVLVEQDGQKSELTIFNGYGGDSLMPKDKETSK